MLWPKRPDYREVASTWAHSTTYSVSLSREFWLENIVIMIQGNISTAIGTPKADGLANLIKRVRLTASDATGNRKVIDMSGPAILEYWRQVNGGLERFTQQALNLSTTSTGGFRMFFPIPLRHPQMDDPWGAATMLPLPRLSVDPTLEIELGAATDVGSTLVVNGTTTGMKLQVLINRRDVLSSPSKPHPYIPTELITYERQWNSAGGKQDWEIPPLGTVTGILIQDYQTSAARGTVQSDVYQDWSIEKLSTVIRRVPLLFMQAENDYTIELASKFSWTPITWTPASSGATLTGGTLANAWDNPDGVYYFDFLTDYSGMGAFNLGSALDLNPLAMGGKARLIASSIAATANYYSRFTVHKMFGDLSAVAGV